MRTLAHNRITPAFSAFGRKEWTAPVGRSAAESASACIYVVLYARRDRVREYAHGNIEISAIRRQWRVCWRRQRDMCSSEITDDAFMRTRSSMNAATDE